MLLLLLLLFLLVIDLRQSLLRLHLLHIPSHPLLARAILLLAPDHPHLNYNPSSCFLFISFDSRLPRQRNNICFLSWLCCFALLQWGWVSVDFVWVLVRICRPCFVHKEHHSFHVHTLLHTTISCCGLLFDIFSLLSCSISLPFLSNTFICCELVMALSS